MEVALRRVLREAGVRVVPNMQLRLAGVRGVRRQAAIEAAAFGLPLCHGVNLFVDITMVSPLRADGQPRPGAAETDGLAAAEAEHRKRVHVYLAWRSQQMRTSRWSLSISAGAGARRL